MIEVIIVGAAVIGIILMISKSPSIKNGLSDEQKREVIKVIGKAIKKGNPRMNVSYYEYIGIIDFFDIPNAEDVRKLHRTLYLLIDHLGLQVENGERIVKKSK